MNQIQYYKIWDIHIINIIELDLIEKKINKLLI